MSDWEKILFTSVATIIGGTIVFLVAQILSKRSIEPINELRKAISNVQFTLSYFAPIIMTPISRTPQRSDEAARALRERSAELFALIELVPKNKLLRWISFSSLPNNSDVASAAVQLRAISHRLHEGDEKALESLGVLQNRIDEVEKLLKLRSNKDT